MREAQIVEPKRRIDAAGRGGDIARDRIEAIDFAPEQAAAEIDSLFEMLAERRVEPRFDAAKNPLRGDAVKQKRRRRRHQREPPGEIERQRRAENAPPPTRH